MGRERSGTSEFFGDLKLSLRAWTKQPLLPLSSLVLYSVTPLTMGLGSAGLGPAAFAISLLLLVFVGWFGVERIWYLRAFRDERMGLREALNLNGRFWGRFFGLGMLVIAFSVAVGAVLAIFTDLDTRALSSTSLALTDVLLTFVTAYLAYSVPDTSTALRRGLRMLKDELPRASWYAFAPAAVAVASTIALGSDEWSVPAISLMLGLFLVDLLFKGAIAAYFLRRHEVGPRGSADEKLSGQARRHVPPPDPTA